VPWILYLLAHGLYLEITGRPGPPDFWNLTSTPALVLVQQISTIALVLVFSGRAAKSVLSLHRIETGTLINLSAIPFLIVVPIKALLSGYFPYPLPPGQPSPFEPYFNFVSLIFLAPLSEELLFRGFLLSALSKYGFWPAALIVNILWAAMHAGSPFIEIATTFTLGLLFSFILWRSGSLWTCILAHALCNAGPAIVPLIFRG